MSKELIEKALKDMNEAFAEQTKTIKELVKQEAKGIVDPLLKEKHEKMDEAIDGNSDKMAALEKTLTEEITAMKKFANYEKGKKDSEEEEFDAKVSEAHERIFRKGYVSNDDRDLLAKAEAIYLEKNQISGNDSEGGFVVRPTFTNSITERVFESSPVRQESDVTTIGTSEWVDTYDDSEVEAVRKAETETRGETQGVLLNEVRIRAHTQYAEVEISEELLDDQIINMQNYLERKIAGKFSRQEASDFIIGDGVKKARGILDYLASPGGAPGAFDTLEDIPSGVSGNFDYNSFIDLVDSLFDDFQGNAVLMMKRQTRSLVRKLLDGDGRILWEPNVKRGVPPEFLGYPVLTATHLPAVAADAIPVIFGDFKQGYQIVDRLGMRIIRDETSKRGFVQFPTRRRVGAGVKQFQAIKRMLIDS